MTKAELVEAVASQTGIAKDTVTRVLESGNKQITKALAGGDSVFIRGFGTYEPKKRAAKTARVISRNETILVPAHYTPSFKPSPDFKHALSGLEVKE